MGVNYCLSSHVINLDTKVTLEEYAATGGSICRCQRLEDMVDAEYVVQFMAKLKEEDSCSEAATFPQGMECKSYIIIMFSMPCLRAS